MSASQRGDSLLRAVVEALQAADYAVDERHSSMLTSALVVHQGACGPPGPRGGQVLITHQSQRRCFRIDFLAAPPADAPRPERTLYWYYHPHKPDDLAHIARSLAAAVCGREPVHGGSSASSVA